VPAFNFIEDLTNHHLLEIHHVRQWGPNPARDYGFLASGPVLIVIGWLLTRSGRAAADLVPTGISGRANP
jgi:uncharacterized membrane protein